MNRRVPSWAGWFLLLALATAAQGQTLSTRLPVSESFGRAGLPDEAHWLFSTNGQGRIAVAPGAVDLVPAGGPDTVTTGATGRLRANLYLVTNDVYLLAHDFWLDRDQPLDVTHFVYEGTTSNGVFTLIASQRVASAAGAGYTPSGDLLVPLARDRFYLIGATWNGAAAYGYDSAGLPQPVTFGAAAQGFLATSTTPPDSLTNSGAPSFNAYNQRLRTVDANALLPTTAPFNTAGNRFRGALVHCTNSTTLVGHSFYLGRGAGLNVDMLVYEATNDLGPYALLASNRIAAAAGTNYITSPELEVPLATGRYYLIGAGWTSTASYASGTAAGTNLDFGAYFGSYQGNSSFPGAPLMADSNVTSTAYRQLFATGDRSSLRLDDGVGDATYSTNFAQLRLNLLGETNITLSFKHCSRFDENDATDGVYLSADGTNFVRVLDLAAADQEWHDYAVDLVATAATLGVTLTGQTRIRFQQADNYPWGPTATTSDGRAFDDIRVFAAQPDLVFSSLAVPTDGLLRGTDVAHTIEFDSALALRGGPSDEPARAYALRFQLLGLGTSPEFTRFAAWTTAVPALVNTSSSLVHQFTLNPGEKLSNVVYAALSTVDVSNQLAEASEINNTGTVGVVLNHYAGDLYFGGVRTFITITNWTTRTLFSPTEHTIWGTGTVAGYGFTFTNLWVTKDPGSLAYTVATDETEVIHLLITPAGTVAGVDYTLAGGVFLTRTGAFSTALVQLPTGAGYTSNRFAYTADYVLPFTGSSLDSDLAPAATVRVTNDLWYCEESKPFLMRSTDLQWYPTQGLFLINASDLHYVRGDELDELEADEAGGLIQPGQGLKRSNEQYHRFALTPSSKPEIRATTAGVARLHLHTAVGPGAFRTHFPYDTRIGWSGGSGRLVVSGDLVSASSSWLAGVSNIAVRYKQGCGGDCPGANPTGTFTLAVAGTNLNLTLDGGLQIRGRLLAPTALAWGYLPSAAAYAQLTDPFTNATFFAPGCFLDRGEDASDLGPDQAAGVLLLSGVHTTDLARAERPYEAVYAKGLADYAGLNFRRPPTNQTFNATSLLGGVATPAYPLGGRSKYYARLSGVSGIHEARSGTTFDNFFIYGYPFHFSNYGLNYLSSSNRDSRTEGDVTLAYPSDFIQAFEQLKFTCLGDLADARVPAGGGAHTLAYWDAPISVSSIAFTRNATTCSAGSGFLTLGLKTFADHVPEPLYGTLGFFSNGNLIAQADGLTGVDSTLDIVDEFAVAGPGGEQYVFYPANPAGLNDYAVAGPQTNVAGGFVSIGGTLDVPFFENLLVHLHTGAGTNHDSQLHLMGGWPDAGWTDGGGATFFTTSLFDTNNWGYPAGATSLATYRGQTNASYQARALKEWLGVVDFNYPLSWSPSTRSFRSPAPVENDFFVLNVAHQVDYLSADQLEVSFGAQYGDLPTINVANMMINAVDEATGVASAFTTAASEELVDTLDQGLDDLAAVLEDDARQLFDAAFDQALDPAIHSLHQALQAAYVPGGADYYSATLHQHVRGLAGAPATNVLTALLNVADGIGATTGVIGRLDRALARAESAIDAVIGQVTVDPDTGALLGSAIDGLLTEAGGQYPVLDALGGELLRTVADSIAAALGAELDGRVGDQLAELQPTLEAARAALQQTRDRIADLRSQLGAGQQFAAELQAAIDPAVIDEVATRATADLIERFAGFEAARSPFDDYTAAELEALIRQTVEARFFASTVAGDVQAIVRARLYDAESALRAGVDTVFQQINTALRNLASAYLSGLDDTINGFLDDLSSVIGAGQIDGHASIRGDALTELRLDGRIQFKVPDEVEYQGYLLIEQLDATGGGGCTANGEKANRVTVGANDIGCSWLGSDIRVNVAGTFAFAGGDLVGLGGSFEMADGTIRFEQFEIDEFNADMAFGQVENYLAAGCGMRLGRYEVSGGLFFGRTCTLAPIEQVDPEVASVLGAPPFTGGYVYGEGWMPIVDLGCVFNISAGVGAGIFYFVEGPTYGAKLTLGASGEALCVVSIKGTIKMVGAKVGDSLRATGQGKLSGKAGACPFCVEFNKTVTATYKDGEWDVDY